MPWAGPLQKPVSMHGPEIDTRSLKAISSGGALLTAPVRELIEKRPLARSMSVGGSEVPKSGPPLVKLPLSTPRPGRVLHWISASRYSTMTSAPSSRVRGTSDELPDGAIFPLGYYKDPEKTASTFRSDPDGVRWVVPGDWARVEDDGTISLLGRGSQCINSGGEKIFPDEIEAVLAQHLSDPARSGGGGSGSRLWMERVVALVEPLDPAESPPSLAEVQAHCRTLLAGYKTPRGPGHR